MKVRMPDGTVIDNVPEGITQSQLLERYEAYKNRPAINPIEKGPISRYTNPERDTSALSRAGRGAWTYAKDLSMGVSQRLGELGTKLGVEGFAEETAALKKEEAQNRIKNRKLMETSAGKAGYVGGALIPAVGASFIPGANTLTGATLVGGALGATQPTVEGESVLQNTGGGALFGLGGQGAAKLVSAVAQPVKQGGSAVYRKSVEVLEDAGVKLNAAQKTDSGVLKQAQRFVANNPFTQPKEAARFTAQRQQYTKAVLKTLGVTSDAADETTMAQAGKRISDIYDDVLPKHSIRFSGAGMQKMADIGRRSKLALEGADNQITRIIDDIGAHAQANGGRVSGEYYKNMRSTLLGLQKQPGIAPLATELREGLDNAFKTSAGAQDAARLTHADKLYARLVKVEKAIEPDGSVSPAKLWNAVNEKGSRRMTQRGKGDGAIRNLARAGKNVLIEKMPDSGTAARAGLQVVGGGTVGALFGDNPEERLQNALIGGAGLYMGPKALQRVMGSNYLTQGLPNSTLRNALQVPAERGIGLGLPAYMLAQQ